MKHFLLFAALLVFVSSLDTSLSYAASNPGVASNSATNLTRPKFVQMNYQLKTQWKTILEGRKSGTLTKSQALTQIQNLKEIRKKELEFVRQNGKQDLSSNQVSQLKQLLNITH